MENYTKIDNPKNIEKFLLESFIYENNFNLFYKNIYYSGILLKLEYNGNKAIVIRFSEILPDNYSAGKIYRLTFNNSRGKFYTDVKILEIFNKGNRTFIITEYPEFLFRLQRRNSIRVIPDYVNNPIIVKFLLDEGYSELKVRDIGLEGFSITLSKDSAIAAQRKGDILPIELKFPDSKWSYNSKVELIHGSTILSKYRAGFKFIEIDSNLKNEIINYLIIRRLEIKNKILQKEKKKDIYEHLGEWLDNFLKFEKEKFNDFKIAIFSNYPEKFKFLESYFNNLKIFTPETFEKIIEFNPYFVVFHITKETKSKWFKFVKQPEFQYVPTILVSQDKSILHLLKNKTFYSTIVEESKINEKLVDTIAKYSNVLIPHILLDSLMKKPDYDGEGKDIAIIDDSIFGFSSKIILQRINFNVKFFRSLNEFYESEFEPEIVIIDPTVFEVKKSFEIIFKLNRKFNNLILTFIQKEPYFQKFTEIFSEYNLLIKPFKYDNLISKVMIFKDDIEEKPLFRELPIYVVSLDKEFFIFFEELLESFFPKGSFKIIDISNNLSFEFRNQKIFFNLNAKYSFNYLDSLLKKHFKHKNEVIGIIYRPIHKKLLLNYINLGIKKVILANNKEKFFDKFKEYYFLDDFK